MLTSAKINLRETSRLLRIHLDKFGKEISRDYKIKVPKDVFEMSSEEFHAWVISNMEIIFKTEKEQGIESILAVLLASYKNSYEQIKKATKQEDIAISK